MCNQRTNRAFLLQQTKRQRKSRHIISSPRHSNAVTTNLVVLDPTHVGRSFAKRLSLHVDAVLANQAHSSLSSSDSALTTSFAIILGVGSVEFVGGAAFDHFSFLFSVGKTTKGEFVRCVSISRGDNAGAQPQT